MSEGDSVKGYDYSAEITAASHEVWRAVCDALEKIGIGPNDRRSTIMMGVLMRIMASENVEHDVFPEEDDALAFMILTAKGVLARRRVAGAPAGALN